MLTDAPSERDRYIDWATTDPVGWSRKVLRDQPGPLEVEMMEAVRDHPQIAIRGCHASGKTYRTGRIALWWVSAAPQSIAILTGPTFRQVQENAWAELVSAYRPNAGLLGGHLLDGTCKLRMGPRWGVLSFATDNPINLSGFHGARVLLMVDEASGVDEGLYRSLEGMRASGHVRVLLTSQGTQTAGTFYDAFHTHRRFWHCIQISAFRTPNFQPDVLREWLGREVYSDLEMPDEEKARLLQEAWREAGCPETGTWPAPLLVNPAWACELGEKYGLNDDMYVVRVLGGFGKGDPYALVSLHWFERARSLVLPPSSDSKTWIGLDIAERGDDDCALWVRRGPMVLYYEERHGHDTVQTAGWAAEIARRFGATDVNLDANGVGAGVAPVLRPQLPGVRVHDIMLGGSAHDKEQFLNFRAEMFWGLRERFEGNEISLAGIAREPLERTSAELTGLRWKRTPQGKVQIEAKDEFKKRLGRSPDAGDGLALAFAVPTDELTVLYAGGDDEGDDPFDW